MILHFLGEIIVSWCAKRRPIFFSWKFMNEIIDCLGFALKSSRAGVCVCVCVCVCQGAGSVDITI